MQLSNPRQYPVAGDHADGLTGAADTRNRTSIIAVFDERYTHNGNLVFAATRHLMKQFSDSMTFQVFCRGKYRGPRFGQSSKVRVVGTAVTPRPYGRRLRDMINRRLARLHLIDSADRCNGPASPPLRTRLRTGLSLSNRQKSATKATTESCGTPRYCR